MGTCLSSQPRLSGEPVCLPGFLGVPKTSQSWAASLSREAVPEASWKGCLWPSLSCPPSLRWECPCPAALGRRLSVSELSFRLEVLGHHSLLRAAPWSHFFPGLGLSAVLGGIVLTTRKSPSGASPCETSLGGRAVSPMGVPGRVCLPMGRGDCVSSGYLSGEGGRVSLVSGRGVGRGVWARRVPTSGSCFSWFVPLPTASLLPGRAPAPTPSPPPALRAQSR